MKRFILITLLLSSTTFANECKITTKRFKCFNGHSMGAYGCLKRVVDLKSELVLKNTTALKCFEEAQNLFTQANINSNKPHISYSTKVSLSYKSEERDIYLEIK